MKPKKDKVHVVGGQACNVAIYPSFSEKTGGIGDVVA
jgi:hypothetical protein